MIAIPKVKFILILLTVLLFVDNIAIAVEICDFSTATLPVSDQSPKTFQKNLPKALEQVLVKMSGNVGIMTLPTIQDVLPKINDYVQKYSYLTNQGGQPLLRVVFDKQSMRHLLQDANQAIWSADRPLTMIWVSVPNGSEFNTLASESRSPTIRVIKQIAFLRGLPIIFPAMDLEDQTNVPQPTSTVLSNNQLQTISHRYGVDSILAGVVVDSNGHLQGEWQLFLKGTSYEWQTIGTDVNQVVINGVDRAIDMMANQFATFDSKGMENLVTMKVSGVQNLNDYVHVVLLLKHLSPVIKVSVSKMNTNVLFLKVITAGNLEDLVKALKTVPHLIKEPSSSGLREADLFYKWEGTQPVSGSGKTVNFFPR